MSLTISEQFLSIQGEGPTTGMPSYFLRLTACNLLCGDKKAKWICDTIEVWKKGEQKTFERITEEFSRQLFFINLSNRTHHLIITGGEPLLQSDPLEEFMQYIYRNVYSAPFIEVETNGTIKPSPLLMNLVSQWNVSPKLSNSGMLSHRRINIEAMQLLAASERAVFKFVISDESDLEEVIQEWVRRYFIPPRKVLLMPAGDSRETLEKTSKQVATMCIENGFRFSPRLHINIWNQKTGV